ncbi:type I-B CRISPR-associated protein Cas7/Cst2/DevR [Aeribacillus composti]|jgi:CRISPR-associated protein Cst2|uniref:Type I-B CRISPR-associated protein Cas7/Cst2/DevR n=1 Tax=Aeribacillus composti TaxID=1868734 RepID=A0ABY9WAB3_9BACI|nr:type I-B CRISPR-associated protein Cas7/Cst2/DevR [Aeribacillus composti]MDR9792429.1 type I-B CRISPR-associated protein Cas7/Cst2/DevR [Aeribacillus pallidus]MDR9798104.1 type I-B CRISPR-associated protein Cas7/Cst2/DevR [Aeribacillus pallidus]MED0717350.1 type I-B CRISPR-associated protein Cas7/Cst2/DevR [Aeribacillus composti]MED0747119.1 type I-B CRISPR-associated protein Cas7/Cst2/DevR [Aeribacillus composti]MED1443414.1 type I-B CRISPR-associated protein Cas7/Cst2/DevR [Aeribacillus c
MRKALSFTVIFQGNSLNYGEGIANISELKKFHRGNGDVHTFASRQSLRYDIVRLGNQLFNWNLDVVDKSKGVIQFKDECTIKDSVEMDLFGYMKTKAKSGAERRSAAVRISHAISLEPFRSDLEFLTNMGLANRIGTDANLANLEQHQSLYTYTVTIDFARIGVDGKIELPNEERAARIKQLLTIIKILNREIKGRQENLAPLFIIGGVYSVANPFFLGRVSLKQGNQYELNTGKIASVLEQTILGEKVADRTNIGLVRGVFDNESEIETLGNIVTIEQFFTILEQEIDEYFGDK